MNISRIFKFEAAHQLPYHNGKCQRPHGHSYRLELTFAGSIQPIQADNPQSGFIADFGVLDRIVRNELIDPYLDHHNLNQSVPGLPYSSVELLSAWIVGWCMNHLEARSELGSARIERVRLWETVNAWAEADRQDALEWGFAD